MIDICFMYPSYHFYDIIFKVSTTENNNVFTVLLLNIVVSYQNTKIKYQIHDNRDKKKKIKKKILLLSRSRFFKYIFVILKSTSITVDYISMNKNLITIFRDCILVFL